MIPDGYRILVVYNSEKGKFVAQVPELGKLSVEGETRSEALAAIEEEIEKTFQNAAANKEEELPPPVDGVEFSGELSVKISPSLHRELSFFSKQQDMDLDQLAGEILSAGLTLRLLGNRQYQRNQKSNGYEKNGRKTNNRNRRRNARGGKDYFDIMDDKASFMEYVRGLEGNTRGGGRKGGRGRGRK
jgi:predicted RNase H-like HicB family nuclease